MGGHTYGCHVKLPAFRRALAVSTLWGGGDDASGHLRESGRQVRDSDKLKRPSVPTVFRVAAVPEPWQASEQRC